MSDRYNEKETRNHYTYQDKLKFEDQYREAKYQDDIAGVLKNAQERERNRKLSAARKKKRRKKVIARLIVVLVALILVLILAISLVVSAIRGIAGLFTSGPKPEIATLIAAAEVEAKGYDYDKAIGIIASYGEKYEKKKELKQAVLTFEDEKSKLKVYPDNSQIPHITFRTLIYNAQLAFDGDGSQDKYNRNMVTVSEFWSILDNLYSRGFVLVNLSDIVKKNNGVMEYRDILLPEGKTPIVISQENLSYYNSLKGNGFASKLVIDEDGAPLCEYTDEAGNVSLGAYDLVPILESFIKEHPDFSYRGARATLSMTGYDGVLGYRTNPKGEGYKEEDIEQAKSVVKRLKELGYEFAGNTWDYTDYGIADMETVKKDAERWEQEVKPIIGKTNILLFAGGTDIANYEDYKDSNEKYTYLKEKGFEIFCPTTSEPNKITLGDSYLRVGRRMIEGRNLLQNPDMLSDLFVAKDILDSQRPNYESE